MLIRECEPNDFISIYGLNKYAFGYDFPVERTKQRLAEILAMPTEKIFVAIHENKIVGYIHCSDYQCTYAEPMKNIMAIAVDETCRGMGIGKALLKRVEEQAAKDCCAAVRLVSGFNREGAHGFYLSCGYTLRKEQKNFIKIL